MSTSDPIPVTMFLDKELSARFRKWQRHQPDHHGEIGMISTAAEFCRFYKDDKASKGVRTSDETEYRHVGSKCGDVLHPAEEHDIKYCPVCEVEAYLDLQQLIAQAWDITGGRTAKKQVKEKQMTIRHFWRNARVELEELLAYMEDEAKVEGNWEEEHPKDAEGARASYSATNAVNLARLLAQYPSTMGPQHAVKDGSESGRLTRSKAVSEKKKRNAKFVYGTNFSPSRPKHAFQRNRPVYKPGKHAAGTLRELVDTSNMTNRFYTARQLKVITHMGGLPIPEHIDVSKHEGIADLHPRQKEINQVLTTYVHHKNPKIRAALMKQLENANFLLLCVQQDKVIAAIPLELENMEDVGTQDDEDIGQGLDPGGFKTGWVSLLDILTKSGNGGKKYVLEEHGKAHGKLKDVPGHRMVLRKRVKRGTKKRVAGEDFEVSATKRVMR
ncbi:hypothetical protein N0V83_001781 [Neocucurbitaria cava]|uniref:Uncharacterized protein n=1 Tax=Neocucurbitaria cava TaxID=798079 RepID=A0A9W8YGX3_9PLEO|nr:hypothetical protein N0V83_001781 [Neocucurbitaria cava]